MTTDSIIKPEDLPPALRGDSLLISHNGLFEIDTLKDAKDSFERQYITHKLSQFGENISKTAEAIGIERSHLYRKIKNLNIEVNKE